RLCYPAQLDDSLTRRSVAYGFLLLGWACFSEWVLMASIPDFPSFLHIFSPFRPPSFCFSHLSGAPRLILHDCCPPDQELTLQQPRCAIRGQIKASTLLRYLRTMPAPSDAPVRVVGIDDFAMRRGDSYGTILVNLETGKPLDLLPDRTAEAVLPWLASHQEIEVVSRDRARAYADAVKRALPHALQVADRYHLAQNLREHLQQFLDHKRSCLPVV